ncbi:MAG TPA: hypothetical protein VK515_02440 [Rhizomicrobium sp.]|nr:hypothetical protein [Rhizomicrobium sp.]
MSRSNIWKHAGWGAVLVAAVAAPGALYAVRAAPERLPSALPATVAAGKPFAGVCKANEVVDSRPDPAWVGASFSGDNCWAPPMPARLDGFKATREQIVAGMAAAKRYAVLSDAYQRCISDFVAARKAQSSAKPVSTPLVVIETHRILVAQENKKKADAQIKVAINAFNEYGSGCPDQ